MYNQGSVPMKHKKLNFIIMISIFMLCILAACSSGDNTNDTTDKNIDNVNKKDMPIVKEPIELDIFVPVDADGYDEWEDILVWNEYEDMTNIHVNWEKVPAESMEEKTNLALNGKDIPEAFYAAGISSVDLFKHGKHGTFIELNDVIGEYARNLMEIMDGYTDVTIAMTFPDGTIYALPTIIEPESMSLRIGSRPWIREDSLDNLALEMPETTDEFYEYLKAVKTKDPNGNGENDEIPFGGRDLGINRYVEGAFNVANRGPANPNVDEDADTGVLRFYATSESYKDMLTYLHKLFDEELIEQSIFSIDENQYR